MSGYSILRITIVIFTSWALLFGMVNIRFYCAITSDGVKSGHVFARTEEEFIQKTGLPVNTINTCKPLYFSNIKEYIVKTEDINLPVISEKRSSTETVLSIAGIYVNPLDQIITEDDNTIVVKKGWLYKKAKLVQIPPLIWKQVIYYDKTLPVGKIIRLQKAESGLKEIITYQYILDGQIIKEWTEEKIIKEAKPWVFKSGPLPYNGPYIKKFIALITAYSPEDPGVDWITATGDRVRKGVVAVDPRLVPLRSKLYVDGYGESIALDVGGWIKYYHIDVFFPTKEEAIKWGAQYKWVYILEYPPNKK